jgi:hypothetical protein
MAHGFQQKEGKDFFKNFLYYKMGIHTNNYCFCNTQQLEGFSSWHENNVLKQESQQWNVHVSIVKHYLDLKCYESSTSNARNYLWSAKGKEWWKNNKKKNKLFNLRNVFFFLLFGPPPTCKASNFLISCSF